MNYDTSDASRDIVRHFLAALAYRTAKALREAPESFATFRVAENVRTPHELLWHMTGVLGYARTFFVGGAWQPPAVPFAAEIARFHELLHDLDYHLRVKTALTGATLEQLLQGPLSDAMTHAGQLALLRRLAGSPVPSENFMLADVRIGHVGPAQPAAVAPDAEWSPDRPPHPPGRRRSSHEDR